MGQNLPFMQRNPPSVYAERAADPFELGTNLRRVAAHLSKQDSVIGNGRAQVRMFVAGGGGKLKEDF